MTTFEQIISNIWDTRYECEVLDGERLREDLNKLIAEEREACARVSSSFLTRDAHPPYRIVPEHKVIQEITNAIRARGK